MPCLGLAGGACPPLVWPGVGLVGLPGRNSNSRDATVSRSRDTFSSCVDVMMIIKTNVERYISKFRRTQSYTNLIRKKTHKLSLS